MTAFQNKKDKEERVLDMGRGCEFCGCGTDDVSVTVCGGCHKLHVTDWLQEYPDSIPSDIFEVRFKNTRRSYYRNVNGLSLKEGDIVAVEASPGHDIGIISLAGDMVARQMRRVGFNPQNGEFKKIYRKAKPYDIDKWQEAIALEHETMIRARQIAAEMNLNMKIGDVEYQGDKIKAIFYYIADERVDFRELIKVFAEVFHIRVEMKQIGARQEAGRIGGIGPCGRELCCATWMTNFVSVSTNAARIQDISLNPQKLAGQCAKLKCCMNYEVDAYVESAKRMPSREITLETKDGTYYYFKSDILKGLVSYSTDKNFAANLVTITGRRAFEVINMNRNGAKPDSLLEETPVAESKRSIDLLEQESLTRFDKSKKNKKKKKNGAQAAGNPPSANAEGRKQNASSAENKKGGEPKKPQGEARNKPQGEPRNKQPQGEARNKPQGKDRQPAAAASGERKPGNNPKRRNNNGNRPPKEGNKGPQGQAPQAPQAARPNPDNNPQ